MRGLGKGYGYGTHSLAAAADDCSSLQIRLKCVLAVSQFCFLLEHAG